MRQIENRPLWVGHAGDARDLRAVLAAGINAVIELADSEAFAALPRELVRCRFPLSDGGDNPSWLIRLAAETVAALLRAGVPTLVLCASGLSRSVCVAAGGLALAEGRCVNETLKDVVGTGPADVAPDKGYHSTETIATVATKTPYRTYIPEPRRKAGQTRVWVDKPAGHRAAVYANRRRTRGARGKRLQRLRSERVERSFAHVCETGGARRTWIRGIDEVRKRYVISALTHNLGRIMRALFGMGTPRGLQKAAKELAALLQALYLALLAIHGVLTRVWPATKVFRRSKPTVRASRRTAANWRRESQTPPFSTGC